MLAEYTFNANAYRDGGNWITVSLSDNGANSVNINALLYRMGKIGMLYIYESGTGSAIYNKAFNTLLTISGLPFTALGVTGFVRGIGATSNDGMDAWQVSSSSVYMRKRGGGNLTGTFSSTACLLNVCIFGSLS